MNRLILMRHAKTEAWHEGSDDHGRALMPSGAGDAAAMGQAIVDKGWEPGAGLVSTARRARETWRHAAPAWGGGEPMIEDDLYLAAPATLETALSRLTWSGALLVIGHNPGIHEFACFLARQGPAAEQAAAARLFEKFPTGCAAFFEGEASARFHGAAFRLADTIRPKDLRREV
ncbi:MAG: histidine phosphatase family protein [Pseudomonadota bacterium]